MYQFRDLSIYTGELNYLPSDDMKVNNLSLTRFLKEYRQLSVEGRGVVGREATYIEVPRRDGSFLSHLNEKKRSISVHFYLQVENVDRVNALYDFLNDYLRRQDELSISFADDPNYAYQGVFVDAELTEIGLITYGTLVFDIADPYQYGPTKSSTGTVEMANYLKVLPEIIEVTPTGTVEKIEVVNARKRIVLNGSYSSPQKILINFRGEDVSITYSGRSILGDLQLYSNLEDFYISNGDRVTCIGGQITRLEWRERKL